MKARTYLILRDIFPDWAVQAGVLKKGLIYYLFKLFERHQYFIADNIGVETSRSVEYFEKTPSWRKVAMLRNWSVSDPPIAAARSYRERLGLAGKTVFFYGGNIGVAQDMDNIMRLAKRMSTRPDAHFLLVGSGSEVERLQIMIRNEAMANVTLLPAVDQDTYMAMLSEFDVGLISLDRRLKTYSNTGKMLGYMRCGLPMLASYNSGNDLEELLAESGAGFGAINGNDEEFHQNALKLCDPEIREIMGNNSRMLLEDSFSVELAVKKILYPSDNHYQGSGVALYSR
jgi:glycosyltransferase involved in cell wall biosynthesis